MKKNLIILAEVAIFAALGYVLDLIAGLYSGYFVNGGSIGIAMVMVLIVTYRHNFLYGLLCGLIMGLLGMTSGVYAISDAWWKVMFQILLDYILAYPAVSICALLKPLVKGKGSKTYKAIMCAVGMALGGTGKFVIHFLAGVCFWPEYEGQPFFERSIYSVVYNGSYTLPSILLSMLVVFGLVMLMGNFLFPKLITEPKLITSEEDLNELNK